MSVVSFTRRTVGTTLARTQPRVPSDTPEQSHHAPSFSEFLVVFRQDFSGWSPVTWRGLSGVLRNLEAEFGAFSLDEITPRSIDRYLSRRRREDGITTATCNRYLAGLKTLFKQARIWGYVDELPTDALQMRKEHSKVPAALTDTELEQLLKHCPEPTRTIVVVAADTGMRRSELRRLAWQDVDLTGGTLTIPQTKNGHFRVIPLTRRVAEILRTMASLRAADEFVLPRSDFSRSLARAAEKAGVGHVHPHMLRHTYATRLRDRGVPLDRIMELMGHRSYAMVLRYAKARPQQLIEAVRMLDGYSPIEAQTDHRVESHSFTGETRQL
jgi:integrase